jgi:hypothetical protein
MIFSSSEKLLKVQMYVSAFLDVSVVQIKPIISERRRVGEDDHVARHNNDVPGSDESPVVPCANSL